MPGSLLPYLDPQTGRRIPDVQPEGVTHLTDAARTWGATLAVEEGHYGGPYEYDRAFALPGPVAAVILDPIPWVERMAGDRWYTGRMDPGDVMLVPPQMPISGRWREGEFRVLSLLLDPSHVARAVPEAAGAELRFEFAAPDPQIERVALMLRDELATGCPGGRLFGEGLATALVAHLLTRYAVHPARIKEYVRGLGKSDLSRVLAFIGDRLADDLSLEDLAACCHLSPYHFCRLFKQSSGQSPHQYVIAQRVEKAKSLLRCGGLTVGEVAQVVGFSDHSKLHHHFKKLTGLTPRQYSKR